MKTPARMAPPERSGLTPMASSIVAVMTPIVATVPKAVPVSVERRPLRRKAARSPHSGVMKPAASVTRRAIVPEALHEPVSMPMSAMTITMPMMVRTPFEAMAPSALRPCPRKSP